MFKVFNQNFVGSNVAFFTHNKLYAKIGTKENTENHIFFPSQVFKVLIHIIFTSRVTFLKVLLATKKKRFRSNIIMELKFSSQNYSVFRLYHIKINRTLIIHILFYNKNYYYYHHYYFVML